MDPLNLERAAAFLREPRVALVGLSRDEKDFSRYVLRELVGRGIDVVPVHPSAAEIEGRRCFARLQEVAPGVPAALVMVPPAQAERVLADCVEAGVKRVWLHRGGGRGAGDERGFAFCAEHGLELVRDLCPFMALPGAGAGHRLHGWFRKRLS